MNVIVFGGSGYIGSHLCDVLLERGHNVTNFDKSPSKTSHPNSSHIAGDILNAEEVEKAIQDQDIVYNFAGLADLDAASDQPLPAAKLNVVGNINILEACRKKGSIKRFLYASTLYVYSESGGFYRCSKQASEIFIEEYKRKYNLPFTILRYGTVYGPRADKRNSMFRYLSQALREGKINYAGNGEELREYIHVRDAAILSADCLEKEYENQRFIITGHQTIRVNDMFRTVFEILKKPFNVKYLNKGVGNHYEITPYSYVPKVGKKLVSNSFTDIGQGLIECLTDMETIKDKVKSER